MDLSTSSNPLLMLANSVCIVALQTIRASNDEIDSYYSSCPWDTECNNNVHCENNLVLPTDTSNNLDPVL